MSISSFRDSGCCRESILFWFITNPSVVFLGMPGGFLASHDPVSPSFLKFLWITLLDFPTVFEISPIKSLSSLRKLIICFLSSNDVRFFRHVYNARACEEQVQFSKILYSIFSPPQLFFNNTKLLLNFWDLFKRSNVFDHQFFRMSYDYSYNFIKISLLSFIFWNFIIYLYILFLLIKCPMKF